MNEDGNGISGRLIQFANRHRRKLWVCGAVIVAYTVLGFFFVPWLVQKIAVETVRDQYAAELAIEKVDFNPYVLSLRLDGLSFRDPDDEPFLSVDQIYVNLQTSSLFRLAPTFAEIRLDAPVAHLARDAAGDLNAGFLAAAESGEEATEATPESSDSGPPRLIVHQFIINAAALHWDDAVPPQPVDTTGRYDWAAPFHKPSVGQDQRPLWGVDRRSKLALTGRRGSGRRRRRPMSCARSASSCGTAAARVPAARRRSRRSACA